MVSFIIFQFLKCNFILFLRDLENNLVPIHSYTKHRDIINDIDGVAGTSIGCGAPELVTGSRDGNLFFFFIAMRLVFNYFQTRFFNKVIFH